jgi:hypothetical protein
MGPVDFLAIEFPGDSVNREVIDALRAVLDKGTIRVVDLTIVKKDETGNITSLEIGDLKEEDGSALDPIAEEVSGLISSDDVRWAAANVSNNSMALLMLFEYVWATDLQKALLNANGRLIAHVPVQLEALEQALRAMNAEDPSSGVGASSGPVQPTGRNGGL